MSGKSSGGGRNKQGRFTTVVLIIIGVAVALMFRVSGWDPIADLFGLNKSPSVTRGGEGEVQVHFIDVGQGDCALILTQDKSVLIDSGESQYADEVIQYIKKAGVETLDLIVVSHAHSDHMGGMAKIITAVDTRKLIMPRLPDELAPTTAAFDGMLDAVDEYSVEVGYTKAGEVFELGEAYLEIIAPYEDFEITGLNDSSIVARLVHGDNTFLFTGDIEKAAENDILERGTKLSSVVLKIAHHGSASSSQKGFLNKVSGKYAVISVGSPNRYNHPNDEVLLRLEDMGYTVCRTDESGTVVFISNQEGLEVETEKGKG